MYHRIGHRYWRYADTVDASIIVETGDAPDVIDVPPRTRKARISGLDGVHTLVVVELSGTPRISCASQCAQPGPRERPPSTQWVPCASYRYSETYLHRTRWLPYRGESRLGLGSATAAAATQCALIHATRTLYCYIPVLSPGGSNGGGRFRLGERAATGTCLRWHHPTRYGRLVSRYEYDGRR